MREANNHTMNVRLKRLRRAETWRFMKSTAYLIFCLIPVMLLASVVLSIKDAWHEAME